MYKNRNNDFDDFMLDQEVVKKPNRNVKPKENEFNFLDDEDDSPPLKLPVIKDKIYEPQKPKSRQRETETKQQQNLYFQDLEEEKPSVKSRNGRQQSQSKSKSYGYDSGVNDARYDQGQNGSQNYENDFQGYDNDFQEEEVQDIEEKPVVPKIPEKKAQLKIPPKASTTKNIPVNKSVSVVKSKQQPQTRPKQTSLYRSGSRNSLKSGRTNMSLRKAVDPPSNDQKKFQNKVLSSFPQINLQKLRNDQIQKLDQKARAMIRQFNNQLNEVINKVALNQKKQTAPKKNIDDVIKLLEESKKNNLKILQRGSNELKKLTERTGSVKDQEYEIGITMEINSLTESKKELQKAIIQMKAGYNIMQKKGSSVSKAAIESLKNNIIHLRKEVEKNQSKDQGLIQKHKELVQKSDEVSNRHKATIDKAHDKGIEIQSTTEILSKLHQLQQKQKNNKKNVQNTINLYKTKVDIVNNENMRIKRDIINCQAQVKDIYSQIVELANKSAALIEKQKENPKLMKNVLHSLEVFSKSISNPPPIFEGINSYDVNSPAGSLHRRKNNNSKLSNNDSEVSYDRKTSRDVEINQNHRSIDKSKGKGKQQEKEKNSFKPNFKKQKHNDEKIESENKPIVQIAQEIEKEVEKVKTAANNLKPTFNFKKRNQNKEEGDQQKEQPVKESPKEVHKQPEPGYQFTTEEPVAKPFTRFKRHQPSQDVYSLTQPEEPKSQNKIQPSPTPEPVIQPSQPKRFILRKRGNQEESESGGYNPTIQKSQQTPKQTVNNSQPEERRFNFGNKEQTTKNIDSYQPSYQQPAPSYQPGYNQPQPSKYEPSTESNPPPRVRGFSNRPKEPQPSYSFNPTITPPKQQKPEPPKPVAPPKEREGRIKKQKFNFEPEKKGGSMFSHAEDLTNEFMTKQEPKASNPSPYSNPRKQQQELDLNQLIGNNKKRRSDDDDDIVFEEKKPAARDRPKANNQNDFFGFDL